jgi:hypothetical protein
MYQIEMECRKQSKNKIARKPKRLYTQGEKGGRLLGRRVVLAEGDLLNSHIFHTISIGL